MKNRCRRINITQIVTWAVILLTQFIFYKNVEIATLCADSYGYIELSVNGFLSGTRMPIYPLLIGLCKALFPEKYLIAVVWLQIMISLGALALFEEAVYIATDNQKISCIMAVMWGGSSGVIGWNVIILTESLSLSFSIVLLYFTVAYLKTNKFEYGVGMSVSGFLSTWLKMPLFVYTFAILFLLFIQFFMHEGDKNGIKKLILINIVFIGIYILYAYSVWKHSGIFGLSTQGPRHILASCLASRLYENYPQPKLVREIERIFKNNGYGIGYTTTTQVMSLIEQYQISVKEFDLYCIKSDVVAYIKYLMKDLFECINVVYNSAYVHYVYESTIYRYMIYVQELIFAWLKIGHVCIVCTISLIMTIRKCIMKKEYPWFYFGVFGILLVILVSVFVGTYSEYMRSTSYALPFVYFGISIFINEIIISKNHDD